MSELKAATQRALGALAPLRFGPPVAYVYNPLVHARRSHEAFLQRFGSGEKEVLLVGMNPGPFGMVQTGVPFGEVAAVRDWLGIEEPVDRPVPEHPKRPVEGFACRRSEVSGRRLWNYVAARCRTPEDFFARFFIHNFCPLAFMEEGGRNVTPDKLKTSEREPLLAVCDAYLRDVVDALRPSWVVGVGAFAEDRARRALAGRGDSLRFGRIPHPSPASPLANRGWDEAADAAFAELGLELG
ncbi:MAG: single-stranded DNA-binding protein [Planctomycetota bacterium]|nr:single-stranded DNA-binding protein [Planctomycetota bacterium]MDA0932111.1 single-stranded DNA-binding protein [Planctomycetota bacterium]MDA1220518.1 single-stranded DNA-binding protein [Planctomycetota bacterium]